VGYHKSARDHREATPHFSRASHGAFTCLNHPGPQSQVFTRSHPFCVLLSFIWSPIPILLLNEFIYGLPSLDLFNPRLSTWPHPVFQCFPLMPLVSALLPTTTLTNLIYYFSPKGSALLFQAAVPSSSSSSTQNTIPLLCPFSVRSTCLPSLKDWCGNGVWVPHI
jgi:hypothetical protein